MTLRVLVCAAGQGAGEAAAAAEIVSALRRAGHRPRVFVDSARNAELVGDPTTRQVDWATAWWRTLAPSAFDAVIASSSLTCGGHLVGLANRLGLPPILTVDSSWLPWYNPTLHRCVDRFMVHYPERLFAAGFSKDGGDFAPPPEARCRMEAAGWLFPARRLDETARRAARRAVGIPEDGRLVVFYPSYVDGFERIRAELTGAAALLAEDPALSDLVMVLGHTSDPTWPPPFRPLPWVPRPVFEDLCAAADLVVGGGLGSVVLSSARAGVPCVIWNPPAPEGRPGWDWGEREARAAAQAGAMQQLSGRAAPAIIAATLRAGLMDPVLRREQIAMTTDGGGGAAFIVSRMEALVALRRSPVVSPAGTLMDAARMARSSGHHCEASVHLRAASAAGARARDVALEQGELSFDALDWSGALHAWGPLLEAGTLPAEGDVLVRFTTAALTLARLLQERGDPARAQGLVRDLVRALPPHEQKMALDQWADVLRKSTDGAEAGANDSVGVPRQHDAAPGPCFLVPGAMWNWTATEVIEQGIGGTEETIVELARSLAHEGATVNVFGPVPEPEVRDRVHYWRNHQLHRARHGDTRTLVVCNAAAKGAEARALLRPDRMFLWLHCANYRDLNAETARNFDGVVAVSEWHRRILAERHHIPIETIRVIGNFIVPDAFLGDQPLRPRYRVAWTSSPDRGLDRLLRLWPAIRGHWPTATLDVCCGWRGLERLGMHNDITAFVARLRTDCEALLSQPGIRYHGFVPPAECARVLRSAAVWAYPTATEETFCISAAKARAAGCVPVMSDLGALREIAGDAPAELVRPPPGEQDEAHDEAFLAALGRAFEVGDAERLRMRDQALDRYGVHHAVRAWTELFHG